MKRLISCLLIMIAFFILISSVDFDTAMAKTNYIPIDQWVGQSIDSVKNQTGNYSRIDESQYGFQWYIYNKNYKKFFMLGVQNGQIVAAYSNSAYMRVKGQIKVKTTRANVRNILGTPLSYYQNGNNYYIIPDTDKKDVFLYYGYYLTFFYDSFDSYKVTSVLMIKRDYEDALLGRPFNPSFNMLLAYSRQSIDLVNSIRVRLGLKKLSASAKISQFAASRSNDMVFREYFSHYTPDGYGPAYLARKQGLKFSYLCENIAMGHKNAVLAFEAFMNLKGHRSNILNKKVRQIGTGTAFSYNYSVVVTYIMLRKK